MVKYLNLLFFAAMIAMNYLANALPLNNVTTGQLSDSYPNLFVPAGVTFSIWGVIYLLLAIFCVVQFTGSNQHVILGISWLFGISCLLNGIWIAAWHYRLLSLSLLIMLALLAVLVLINIRIKDLPMGVIKAAFGIYLGWICVASIANFTALLVNLNWGGFGIDEEKWTIIMIIAGAVITAFTIYTVNNPFAGLAVIWAFIGISIKRQDDYRTIFMTAIFALILVAVVSGWGFIRKYS